MIQKSFQIDKKKVGKKISSENNFELFEIVDYLATPYRCRYRLPHQQQRHYGEIILRLQCEVVVIDCEKEKELAGLTGNIDSRRLRGILMIVVELTFFEYCGVL